jgi:type III pantothenate kinase
MVLAIDIGNTETKLGWFAEGRLAETETLSTHLVGNERGPGRLHRHGKVALAAVACVVPETGARIRAILGREGIPARFLSGSNSAGLALAYETPETLGADRIANGLYLAERAELPAVCADFGTATKLDVVDGRGAYVGGAILPGAKMLVESLRRGTAQLPEIEVQAPARAIGKTTKECLQSGTVLALAKAVDGLIEGFARELGGSQAGVPANRGAGKGVGAPPGEGTCAPFRTILATGGLSTTMAPLCMSIGKREEHLTLEGLFIAARRWTEAG